MKTKTYESVVSLEYTGRKKIIPIEVTYIHESEDSAHGQGENVEVCNIQSVEPKDQRVVDALPDQCIQNLEAEILEKIHNAKRHRVAHDGGYALGEYHITQR